MILLGIDVGTAKTGVARADSGIAQPLLVIREKDPDKLAQKLTFVAEREEAHSIVIGVPQGEIARFAKKVGSSLKGIGIKVVFWDETLTTQDAQRRSIEAGLKRKRRRELEDAFAAAIMLQSYIDSREINL